MATWKKTSRTERFLKGRRLPRPESVKQVTPMIKTVLVNQKGDKRKIIFRGGTEMVLSKKRLKKAFNSVLRKQQIHRARASVRTDDSGQAAVTLGGKIKGERRTYASKANALTAIKKYYK